MAVHQDREAFIPYRRSDLIELCVSDGKLSAKDAQKFREFCTILSAYYHFKFHTLYEKLKDSFAPFNPDSDTREIAPPSPEECQQKEYHMVQDLETLLESANYVPLPKSSLKRAFDEKSLIALKTDVDFRDFDQMVCYCRGDIYKMASVKKWFFWKKQIKVDIFERVVLLIKFKGEEYFARKQKGLDDINFTPGKMYLYYYKNIPKFDLEFLFPNIKISMTWKDRLLFGIPAIGAAVPLILKILPQLLLILSAILFIIAGTSEPINGNVDEQQAENIMPVLVATLSLIMALGGFAFKQYSSYKSKKIKFQKKVTDTLFFKNIATNAGVLGALVDSAEEEECKEIILAYYHLLVHPEPLTPEELDDRVEHWMEHKFKTTIDFDIHGPLRNLTQIRGKIDAEDEPSPLLSYDRQGACQVLPLDDAKAIIDYVWDNAFLYARG
jgi:hypothetical protein